MSDFNVSRDPGQHPCGSRDDQTAPATAALAWREVALNLEYACEQLAATRDIAIYDAMIAAGQADAMIALDNARRAVRELKRLRANDGGA